MPTDDTPYNIGRGKPPKHTRFGAGVSGNPKGRPKGSKNFATTIQGELKRRVVVNENGHRKNITKREAVAKQLINRAAAGDSKSIPVLLNEARRYEQAQESIPQETLAGDDALVAANIVRRIREAMPTPATSPSEANPPSESASCDAADTTGEWECQ